MIWLNWREGAQPPGFGTLARRLTARTSMASSRRRVSISCGNNAESSYIAPVPSIGFRGLAKSGMKRPMVSTVAGASGGNSMPTRSAASAT